VNRGHPRILEQDVLSALDQYSTFAYTSLEAEVAPRFPKFEEVMTELMGENTVIDKATLEAIIKKSQPQQDTEALITLLGELGFLGFEVELNKFEYVTDSSEFNKIVIRATKIAEKTSSKRYQINPVFHRYLELKPQ
jgi:hypothetical protein